MNRTKLIAMLSAGVALGILSSLPIAGWLWFVWAFVGGGVAAWLHLRRSSQPSTYADGAILGLAAGGLGGIVNVIGTVAISLASIALQQATLNTPEKALARDLNTTFGAFAIVTQFLWNLGLIIPIVVLACVGGLVSVALFEQRMPAPASQPASN